MNFRPMAFWFVLSAFAVPAFSAHPNPLSQTEIRMLMDSCKTTQGAIRTLRCRVQHISETTDEPRRVLEGTIDYRSPDEVLLHYYAPVEEHYAANDSFYTMYSAGAKAGYRFRKTGLHPLEKQIMQQVGNVQMNMLEGMRDGYDFSFASFVGDSDVVVAATPRTGWKELSKIWVKISMKHKYLVGLELFDKQGILISQTVYHEPVRVGITNAVFPTRVLTRVVKGRILRTDRIHYTRLIFNKTFSGRHFYMQIPDGVEISEPTPKEP